MTNYYIADTHFSHKRIIEYENRPFNSVEEMNTVMIENWNRKVSKNDSVYILGDFIFSNDEAETIKLLNSLNGNKFLIYGNHDKIIRKSKLVQQKFGWCKEYHINYEMINDIKIPIILFHYPIHTWDKKHYGSVHLYGHVHSNIDDYPTNSYNVGVDVRNFEPVTVKEILNI
jgi:calcineurin-like phosphoesterase family protein